MKTLISWWVKNSVAANLLMVAIILMGAVGFMKLEREFIPSLTVNGMTVSVVWQGASPTDVEEQLITRIEDAVADLDGIDYIESSASEGSGRVSIRTKVSADYDKMFDDVKSRVDGINNLPPDIFRPTVHRWEQHPDYMYIALHGDIDRYTLQTLANEVRDEMAKLPNGALTVDLTKMDEEVTIEISEDALRRYGLTFNEVAAAISGTSVNLSAGNVKTSNGRLQLKARNLANTKEEFEKIVVRSAADGGKVFLGEVANVIDGSEDVDFVATFMGQEAAMFQISSPNIFNISEAGIAFREYIKTKNEELPPGITLTMWSDGSVQFDEQMNLIGSNAIVGMGLVLIILMLFLRPIVAFWVTIGILVSFAGAMAILPALGVSFNMMSTFAILLVIGIVVDDAIVVGESIHLHVEHGVSGEQGAVGGTSMVIKPVFFAVVTTILMFLPWMLLSVPIVAITSQLSLVVIAALSFSLIEAFFILPAHLAHLKPLKPIEEENRFWRFQRSLANGLTTFAHKFFRPFVAMLIKHRYKTLSFFVGLFVFTHMGLVGTKVAKVEMFNEPESNMIQAVISFPDGTSFDRVAQVKKEFDAAVVELNANTLEDFGTKNELIIAPGSFASGNRMMAFIGLATIEDRKGISSKKIAEKLEEYVGPIPDARRIQISADGGGFSSGGGRGVSYGIASGDEISLKRAAQDLKDHLETYSTVTRTRDTLESSAQEMQFTLKPGAESYGITLADVTRQVREAFFGREVQRLPRNGEDVRVVLRYPKAARDSIDSLDNLLIRGSLGVEVPLYSIAEVSFEPGVNRISRRDRKRNIQVGARVRGGPAAIAEIKSDMDDNFFPEWKLRNPKAERLIIEDDDMEKTMNKELVLYGLLMLGMMYGILAIAFKSYTQPFLIIVAIPFAYVGMVFGSIIVGVPIGFMSLLGFFAAAGVAVNDNLVLIDYINRLRDKGVGAYQAVTDACVARFRPILLTSVTTFIGIMPMFAEKSVQAQFLKPMVVALAFGVLFDFFLTLMLVPSLYVAAVDIRRWARGMWTGKRQPRVGSSYNPEIEVALGDYEDELVEPTPVTAE